MNTVVMKGVVMKGDQKYAKTVQKHFSNEMKIHFFNEDTHLYIYPERFQTDASTVT
jgi:hypothetical protein